MQTFPECLLCFLKLVYASVEDLKLSEETQFMILDRSLDFVKDSNRELPPAVIAGEIYKTLQEISGKEDIFLAHKKRSTEQSLNLLPKLKEVVQKAEDPLEMAIRISALGNLMDVANPSGYDLEKEIDNISQQPILGNGLEKFKKKLFQAKNILFLGDNAGETVFDRVLIELVDIPVTYAIKGGPAYDDATFQDALDAGIDTCAQIISNGASYPGTYLPYCSEEFKSIFNSSNLIISKGQANYETLSGSTTDIFYLLKVKCNVVAEDIGLPIRSIAFVEK